MTDDRTDLPGAEGVIARSERRDQIDALSLRLVSLESEAAHLRRDLSALGGRVVVVEQLGPRVAVLEGAVVRIESAVAIMASHIHRLDARLLAMSGLTVAGGALGTIILHALGLA